MITRDECRSGRAVKDLPITPGSWCFCGVGRISARTFITADKAIRVELIALVRCVQRAGVEQGGGRVDGGWYVTSSSGQVISCMSYEQNTSYFDSDCFVL